MPRYKHTPKPIPLGFAQNLRDMPSYVVAAAPVNSSGDVYHILIYLILCRANNMRLPEVILTYDASTTKTQARRSEFLLQVFGFTQHVSVREIETESYWEKPRQKALERYLAEIAVSTKRNISYLDQMACTTVISAEYETGRDVSRIVRGGLKRYSEQFYPVTARRAVRKYVDQEVTRINSYKKSEAKPLIILHVRFSSGANEKQKFDADLMLRLVDYLKTKGFCLWIIRADDRENRKEHTGISSSTPFKKPRTICEVDTEQGKITYDYCKLKHIKLLQSLFINKLVFGLIGNTSGTLDIAAFIGLRVFNMHAFGGSFTYQDFRVMLQLSFMSVEDIDIDHLIEQLEATRKTKDSNICAKLLPSLSLWLGSNGAVTSPSICYPDLEGGDKYSGRHGFRKMLRVTTFYSGKRECGVSSVAGSKGKSDLVLSQLQPKS